MSGSPPEPGPATASPGQPVVVLPTAPQQSEGKSGRLLMETMVTSPGARELSPLPQNPEFRKAGAERRILAETPPLRAASTSAYIPLYGNRSSSSVFITTSFIINGSALLEASQTQPLQIIFWI